MKKLGIGIFIIGLVLGGLLGFFYSKYIYRKQLSEARNYEATQELNLLIDGDVTNKVMIVCIQGNEKIIKGEDSGLKFSKNDFDTNGNFIGFDKNSLIQQDCGIALSQSELKSSFDNLIQNGNIQKLFEVILLK